MGVPKLAKHYAQLASASAGSIAATAIDTSGIVAAQITDGVISYAKLSDNNKRFSVVIKNVADTAAADEWERAVYVAPFACKIISANIITDTAVGADTNTATVSVYNKTQSQSNASLALTAANATTAYVAKSLGAITNATLAASDVITFKKVKSSNGLVFPAGMLQLQIERAA